MKVVNHITHKRQETPYSCGAASFAMLFNMDESIARRLVKCKKTGTNMGNVCNALDGMGVKYHLVNIDEDFRSYKNFLKYNSIRWPLYLSCVYKDRFYVKGRDSIRHHAIAIADGMIYDPSENQVEPVDCYEHVFNKSLVIKQIIIIEQERNDFIKNMVDFL